MPKALSELLKAYAAMASADRRAIKKRLGATERAALRRQVRPPKPKPAVPPRYSFEAYSSSVAKRLAEILVVNKASADTPEAVKTALRGLVATMPPEEAPR